MAEPLDKPEATVETPQPTIVDPHNVTIQYVDWIVTGGIGNGVVNVVLAALDYSIMVDGVPRAVIQTRLRLNTTVATSLHRFLGEILTGASPKPQSNKLN